MRILNVEADMPEFKAERRIKGPSGDEYPINGLLVCRPWLIETNPGEQPRWYFGALRLPDHLFLPLDNCQDCEGHDDAEAARDSFKRYVFRKHFSFRDLKPARRCAVCGEMAGKAASIFFWFDWPPLPLCAKHCHDPFTAYPMHDHQMMQITSLDDPIIATMCFPGGPISLTNRRGWGL